MITKEHIESLAELHLRNTDLFLTGVKVSSGNTINVFVDGDNGVKIQDCVALSRFIESKLDREKEDFSLDVSSHGASAPLLFPRQYNKHVGRELEVKMLDGSFESGKMISCNSECVELEYETRENKSLGKGKITVVKNKKIQYNQIKEAKIKLKF